MDEKDKAHRAARRDKAREMFAVYLSDGRRVLVKSRAEAVDLAHRENGSWSRIPYEEQ